MPIVFIAGPYMGQNATHDHRSYEAIAKNIAHAKAIAARLAQAGVQFFCPHSHSAHFELIAPDVPAQYWYDLDMEFLLLSSAILLLEGWEESDGAVKEAMKADVSGLPVYFECPGADEPDIDELIRDFAQ
jgi:hypothetical protein